MVQITRNEILRPLIGWDSYSHNCSYFHQIFLILTHFRLEKVDLKKKNFIFGTFIPYYCLSR
jgi:hypothetical protein